MLLLPTAPQSITLVIIIPVDYGGIALSVQVQLPIPAELSAYLPASYLVVPISIATQEIHYGTCIASHVVGHNAPESLQSNEVLPPLEDLFLCTKYLRETGQGFWTFSIAHHTLWYCCIISHLANHDLLSLY